MPSLTSLAEQMLAQAKVIDGFLEQKNIPYTSFDEDTLESLPEEIQKVRWDLLDTSHIFKQLVRGPAHSGLDIAFSVCPNLPVVKKIISLMLGKNKIVD